MLSGLNWCCNPPTVGGGGGGDPLDPSDLSLTGWWRAGYPGPPWTGSASAGSSGSRDLTAGVAPPLAVGAQLNGFDTAEGANDSYLVNDTEISVLLTATAWSMVALVRPAAITYAGSSELYLGDGIIMDQGGYCGLALAKGGGDKVYAYQWDGAEKIVATSIALNAWSLVQARYDGTALWIRCNSGVWESVLAGNTQLVTNSILVGGTPSGQWLSGRIAEVMMAATNFDNTTFDGIKSYINDRYALSL